MRLSTLASVAPLLCAMSFVMPLHAQQPAQPPAARITLEQAKQAVEAAEAEAVKNNWKLVFLVADADGIPIYLRRMDGVPKRNYEIAVAKIHTSLTSGMHTVDYAAALRAGTIQAIEGAVTYEGGLLLRKDGQLLGAFSASGARGAEDAQAVKAGMAVIGITP